MARRLLVLLLAFVIGLAGCTTAAPPRGNGSALVADSGPLDAVVKRTFTAYGFRLQSGRVLPEMALAYETYGRLAPDGRNAILITHGGTSSGHAAGKYSPGDGVPGWWDGLIGPGKAIDTNRYFVVASNVLGSSYGSTAPASIDPATGKRYGPDFPAITMRDIVEAQRVLLSALGVNRLVAVAGPSYGGYQAFQWAVTYPDFMLGVVPVVTKPTARTRSTNELTDRFAKDPNWNGGWHYERGGIVATMTELRYETLLRYGANEMYAAAYPDRTQREAFIRQRAEGWAREFDPNSMVALRRARDLRHGAGVRQDPRESALRALAHRHALSASDRARRDGQAREGGRRREVFRDRQRLRPRRERSRVGQVGADAEGVPGLARALKPRRR